MNQKGITTKGIDDLFQRSNDSLRKRAIHLFQKDLYPGPQLCLNVLQPDSYVRPHCRFTDEHIIHYSGKLCSIELDNDKSIVSKTILEKSSPILFIPNRTFQTIVSLEEDSAIWMVTPGPHDPNNFSEYLPGTPGEDENYQKYFEWLKREARSTQT